jgi:hypothetical protein
MIYAFLSLAAKVNISAGGIPATWLSLGYAHDLTSAIYSANSAIPFLLQTLKFGREVAIDLRV